MSKNLKSRGLYPLSTVGLLGVFFACLAALGTGCSTGSRTAGLPKPPAAQIIPQTLTEHGHTRVDNYFWLRERENPKVLEYLQAENDYLAAVMKPAALLEEALYKELVGRIKQNDDSVPVRKNGYYYYSRFQEGNEYPVYCRKKASVVAAEEVLLNVPEMSQGRGYYQVTGLSVSPDNRLLAYAEDTVSRRLYTLRFKDLTAGSLLGDTIPNTSGETAWADDNKTVFYALKDTTTLRPFKIMKHTLGSGLAADKDVYIEKDETFELSVQRSKSDKYIIVSSDSTLSNEYHYLDVGKPDGKFAVIQPRERGLEYSAEHLGDKFYILTNWQAKNFRVMEASVAKPAKENWKDVVPHREDTLVEGIEVFKNYLVLNERKNGLTGIRVIRWSDRGEHEIDFGEEIHTASTSANLEIDTDWVRYEYSSLTTPDSTFDYNMTNREKKLMKQQEVLGGFDKNNYLAERLYAVAKDGVKVPISLVYRKGLPKSVDNPLFLHGYGSYGFSSDPSFNQDVLSLLDRGFVFAIAHIRGGQEMGRAWYDDGKLLHKKNTFTDFIACAEHLIAEKFTNPGKLFAMGGSAGGLLMGAVVNMRPDLFKGVIAAVPWVDVVTTMLDASIPLTTSEYDEWGNPADKTYYEYMLSYSPYDNVEAKAYPAMMVTTGLHDSQVQYWEPAKWVAKMRVLRTDKNPLVLHTNMEAGHGGASGRFRRYKERAREYAFILNLAGINK